MARVTTTTFAVSAGLLPHLRKARDHIDRRYAAELDLDGLAAVAGVSKYHFARCFEAAYGETPIRYLTRRRIERAQDLLRVANLTVTEVCMAVGFSSLGSFSHQFRIRCGESPQRFRIDAPSNGTGSNGSSLIHQAAINPAATAQRRRIITCSPSAA